jgi:AcrR family transcriptional regulator
VARRRERSREEILAATRALILADGLRGLTLDGVAAAVGLTKAALYYYFPSKDALLEELSLRSLHAQAQRLHDAVEGTASGPQALRSLIGETIRMHAQQMDDFRLSYLHPQLAPDALRVGPDQLARVRPLNELSYAGAVERLAAGPRGRAGVDPRLMVFLANLAAMGVVMMKGLVEAFDDPLRYSDDELIEALARIFEAAARP